jgi:hypothetical protein
MISRLFARSRHADGLSDPTAVGVANRTARPLHSLSYTMATPFNRARRILSLPISLLSELICWSSREPTGTIPAY